jgi:(p)ppGpp synthase/HD superfamily hydrolase
MSGEPLGDGNRRKTLDKKGSRKIPSLGLKGHFRTDSAEEWKPLKTKEQRGKEETIIRSRFEEALVFANRLHVNQTRKGTSTPYIAHLLAVTALVIENGGTEDEAIAALLHDAVEDQGGQETRDEIRRRFGNKVVSIVDGCTDTDQVSKPPWRERKEEYIARLRKESSDSVRLVSLADKVHNARTILADHSQTGDAVWARFKGGKEGTLWYYRSFVDAFRSFGSSPLLEELKQLVLNMERL